MPIPKAPWILLSFTAKSIIFTLLRIVVFGKASTALASIGFIFSPFILRLRFPRVTYLPFSSLRITSPSCSSLCVTELSLSDIVSSKSSLTMPSASCFA